VSVPAEVIVNTRLAGVRRFLVSAQEEAAAIREIGLATATTGREMSVTTRRSWLMNQALFTLRRVAYGSTLALLAAGAVALKLGFNFDSAMQQARVALQPVSKDIGGVNKELNYLFNFTKYTPFQFKDMTIAFRQMYLGMRTVGVSAETVNQTLKSMVDALAATGKTSPMNLNRVAIALQHMAFQGRLTGYTVNQLARDGIPIFAALRKEMGLTGDQLHHISTMGIPAQDVLAAINKYIETTPGFMNAAHRQATHTLHGLFTTFKDNLSQTMGLAERGWFGGLQHMAVGINSWFNTLNANLKHSHDLATALDQSLTPRSHTVITVWRNVAAAVHDAWVVFKALASVWTTSRPALWTLISGLIIVRAILAVAAHTTWLWVPALQVLVTWLILAKTWALLAGIYTWFYVGSEEKAAFWTRMVGVWMRYQYIEAKLLAFWTGILSVLTKGYVRNAEGQFVAMTFLQKAALRLRLAFLQLAGSELVAMGPFGWIAAAIIVLVGALVILYFKWKWFHNLVNATARFLYNHWYILAMLPVVGPLTAAVVVIVRNFHKIWSWIMRLINAAKSVVHWFGRMWKGLHHIGGVGGVLGKVGGLIGLAGGGTVTHTGAFMVGERGPEIAYLPKGAAVSPLNSPQLALAGGGPVRPIIIPITLEADGRKLAELVVRHESDVNARSGRG
jgi:tape measure domain-containing protein